MFYISITFYYNFNSAINLDCGFGLYNIIVGKLEFYHHPINILIYTDHIILGR